MEDVMKRLLLITMLFVTFELFADGFKLIEFRKLPADFHAERNSVMDIDMEYCTALRVECDIPLELNLKQKIYKKENIDSNSSYFFVSHKEKLITFTATNHKSLTVDVPNDGLRKGVVFYVRLESIKIVESEPEEIITPPVTEVIEPEIINERPTKDSEIFFYEDFSKIEEGLIPENWIGGSTLSVRPSKRAGQMCLANFQNGKHQFVIPDIPFPNNWKFEMQLLHSYKDYRKDRNYNIKLKIGYIEVKYEIFRRSFQKDKTKLTFNGINTGKGIPSSNQVNLITIEKIGSVIKLFVNSEKVHTIRIDDFENFTTLKFSSSIDFGIYKLEGSILK